MFITNNHLQEVEYLFYFVSSHLEENVELKKLAFVRRNMKSC